MWAIVSQLIKGMGVESPGSRDRSVSLGVCIGRITAGKLEELKVIKKVLRKAKGERPREEGDNPASLPGNQQRAENDCGAVLTIRGGACP